MSWEKINEGLHVRYGPIQFEDFFGDFTKLTQTCTIREFQSHFERLLSRVGKTLQAQQVGCFISGLNGSIRGDIQAL